MEPLEPRESTSGAKTKAGQILLLSSYSLFFPPSSPFPKHEQFTVNSISPPAGFTWDSIGIPVCHDKMITRHCVSPGASQRIY